MKLYIMKSSWLSLVMLGPVLILVTSLAGCTSAPNPTPTSTLTNQQPIEVVSVSGPLPPINPGGPIVEITLKNVSSEPVISLVATIELGRTFTFNFDVTSSNPLLPGENISTRLTLISGGFSDNISYPLNINGTLQNGATFAYTKQVRIVAPTQTNQQTDIAEPTDELAGSQWKAVSINGNSLVEATYISLYFRYDGVVWGYSGLNTYGGSYSAETPHIQVSGGITTALGSSSKSIEEQEDTYQDCLRNATSYRVDGNYLRIYDAVNQQRLVFEKIPEYPMNPSDLVGTSWQLADIDGVSINESQSAALVFDDSGNSGKGSFKTYTGIYDYEFSYEAYGDDIIVTSSRVRRTAEIPEELRVNAGRYFPGISLVSNYRLTTDRLELFTARGETLVFKPYQE
jgi:heat shock protein HslJ